MRSPAFLDPRVLAVALATLSIACGGGAAEPESAEPAPSAGGEAATAPAQGGTGCTIEADAEDPAFQYVSKPGESWRINIGVAAELNCKDQHSTLIFRDLGLSIVVVETPPEVDTGDSVSERLRNFTAGYLEVWKEKNPGLELQQHEEVELGPDAREAHCFRSPLPELSATQLACATVQMTAAGGAVHHMVLWNVETGAYESDSEEAWNTVYALAIEWTTK